MFFWLFVDYFVDYSLTIFWLFAKVPRSADPDDEDRQYVLILNQLVCLSNYIYQYHMRLTIIN